MNGGDINASLEATREALELLRELSRGPGTLPRDVKQRTGAQRRDALVQSLHDLVSAALHTDPPVKDEVWCRKDALLALASAATLAQRLFVP